MNEDFGPASDRILSVPIRPGLKVHICDLPHNLTVAEARRIGNIILAFASELPA